MDPLIYNKYIEVAYLTPVKKTTYIQNSSVSWQVNGFSIMGGLPFLSVRALISLLFLPVFFVYKELSQGME